MTYEQIVEKVRAMYQDADVSAIEGTQAIQVNLAGKNAEGIFYIEVKDGKVNVEPYNYYDNWATVTVAPTNLFKILGDLAHALLHVFTQGRSDLDVLASYSECCHTPHPLSVLCI